MEYEVHSAIEHFLKEYDLKIEYIQKMTLVEHKDWWYRLDPITDSDINFYLPLIALEFSLYPKEFIKKIKLKKLILADTVVFHTLSYEQYRAALPDYEPDTLGFVFSCKERNIKYIRSMIHHE